MERKKPVMAPQKPNAGRIGKVDAMPSVTESGWVSVIKAFNPLGPVAESYARTLAYRLESKRLKIELTRVNKEAEIANNLIDKAYNLKMEELQQRRIVLEKLFESVILELKNKHIERLLVLKMTELASMKVLEPGLSIEERQCFQETVKVLAGQLTVMGQNANLDLQTLVKALPKVDLDQPLLMGHDG